MIHFEKMGALHSISESMGASNPLVQVIYGIKPTPPAQPAAQAQPQQSQPQSSTISSHTQVISRTFAPGLGNIASRLAPGPVKRPEPETPVENPPAPKKPTMTIQKPPPESLDLERSSSSKPPPATYEDLKTMGAHDIYNIPESTKSVQYKLSSLLNLLPTDYTNSSEFSQFRSNLDFLSNRNLLSKHEFSTWLDTMQKSSDPIEDFIRPEVQDDLEQKVNQDPSVLHTLSLHPDQLIEWMHQPLSPLSFAVMIMGTLEHNEWTPNRIQTALRAMKEETNQNPILKQGYLLVQRALQSTNGQINPSQRPSYQESIPHNMPDGGGGVHQGGNFVKGATDIFEGYSAYKTGAGIGSWARRAEQAVQGESAVSAIIGAENAAKVASGVSRLAPAAERLGEVGAVVGIAEGVNELTTALGITKENYVGEGISWVEDKVEDAFQNVLSGVEHFFGI